MPISICGIDYSLTAPALAIHTGDVWSLDNCKIHYITDSKRNIVVDEKYRDIFIGTLYEGDPDQIKRYDFLANWIKEKIPAKATVGLESYSYGSKGMVFEIGENTGHLKFRLWEQGITPYLIPPTVVKKASSGKGNAKKEEMIAAFVQQTGLKELEQLFSVSERKNKSPCADCVDAFFVCKLIWECVQTQNFAALAGKPKEPKKTKLSKDAAKLSKVHNSLDN